MPFRISKRDALFALAVVVVLSGCAGPREAREPEPAEELPAAAVRMADYEDFDPAPYREEPVESAAGVEHDVPERLMQGRAASGTSTTVQGFRVQVFSSIDKNVAVQQEEQLKNWWRENADGAPPEISSESQLPVYVVYIQPYYRVRFGNFTSRESAERARAFIARRYPDAFLVPDTVVTTR